MPNQHTEPPVYLDHNATTPLAPGVLEAMSECLATVFGNPSSGHHHGAAARAVLHVAREELGGLLNAPADTLVFTGGGTESDALALFGATAGRTGHVITQATEHPAVLANLPALQARGIRVTVLPVDEHGLVDPADLAAAITDDTILVSVMHANNETGTIQPITELAAIAHRHGALLHTDAAQTVGKIPLDVHTLNADLLSLAAHKFGGPKGVGALYVRPGVRLTPLLHGGGQEHGLRPGTENVASIAGLAAAATTAQTRPAADTARTAHLRDLLHHLLRQRLGDRVRRNGHPVHRLPNTLNISIDGTVGAEVLAATAGVCASTGSACHDGTPGSPVLTAMGFDTARAAAAIRLSLGPHTSTADVHTAAAALADTIAPHPAVPPPDLLIDGGDRLCVSLLIELRHRIVDLPAGAVVHLIATDPAAPLDLPAWCHLTGHTYLGQAAATRPTYALQIAAEARTVVHGKPWHPAPS